MTPHTESGTFTGAYPIRYICFVWIALMHGGLLQTSLEPISVEMLTCVVSSWLTCVWNHLLWQKPYVKSISHSKTILKWCLLFSHEGPRLFSWVIIRSQISTCLSQIAPLRGATTSLSLDTPLPACHLEGVRNRSGLRNLGVRGVCPPDVCTPCIVIEVVKYHARANHWRDPEKRPVPRWQTAAVVSKKVLGIQ